MRTAILFLLLAAAALADEGLDNAVEEYLDDEELQVTATRLPRDAFETPRAITIIPAEEYAKRRPGLALDALDSSPGLWIEHRTTTTGDPVMRGFAGALILALIDGNTLTTLWGEGGDGSDDMYGKIDSYLIERIEVVRGPTSVLYGSNSLGGVIQFLTRSSRFDYTKEGIAYGGRLYFDFSSANTGMAGRVEHHGASPSWRWLIGVSGADIDHVRGGGDLGIQNPTSGKQIAYDAKVQHRLTADQEIEFFLQRMDRDNTMRFYRPMQDNFNDRVGLGLIYRVTKLGAWAQQLEARLYYQHKKDTRRFFDTDRRGWAKTDTFVAALQAGTTIGSHRITYGFSWERDDGESPDDEAFTLHTTHMDDYVKDAPDSTWDDIGVYIQDEWEISKKWSLILAGRVDLLRFKTSIDQFYDPPGPLDPALDAYSDDIWALTGGLGVVYRVNEEINVVGNVSRGFRQFAPNFGARQTGGGILVPNQLLDPITALNMELGVKVRKPAWTLDAFFYRTELYDFQNTGFGTFLGNDFFDFNQNGTFEPDERVIVMESNGRAYVTGVEIEVSIKLADYCSRLPDGLSLRGGFAWNYGNDRTRNEPLRKVHPANAVLGLRYEAPGGRWWVEFSATMVRSIDRIPADRIAKDPGFRTDPQDITSPLVRPDGSLPGYTVFDLRGGYRISNSARVEIAVENMTDKLYRRLHSRMDAAGLNLRIGVTIDF